MAMPPEVARLRAVLRNCTLCPRRCQVDRLAGETGACGVAERGVLVRHLVMPGNPAGSRTVLETVARIAPGCAVNVMGQYRPAHRAAEMRALVGHVSRQELGALRTRAEALGLVRVDASTP